MSTPARDAARFRAIAAHTPLALVLIAGPQASGKSTVAGALTEDLRRHGERVALVELDQIAAMALPTLPSWEAAHTVFESVTGQWARTELTCVVAEASGSNDEVVKLCAQAPEPAVVVTVVLTAPFRVALSRAQADATRGISREADFLHGVYARLSSERARIHADALIDTDELSVAQSVEIIRSAIGSARDARCSPR